MAEHQDVGRLGELIALASQQHLGIYVQPIGKGELLSGFRSDDYAQFDGWLVGTITSVGGDTLAVGRTVAEAVDTALEVGL